MTHTEETPAPAVYEPLAIPRLLPLLPETPGGLVMFDIDFTIGNGDFADSPRFEARPGAADLVRDVLSAGFRVGFWSAGGGVHARTVAKAIGVADLLVCAVDKADYPMTAASVTAALGEMPILTLDDDWSEALPGVPFLRVQAFIGSRVSARELAAYEAQVAERAGRPVGFVAVDAEGKIPPPIA